MWGLHTEQPCVLVALMKFSSLLLLAFAAALASCGKQETTVVESTQALPEAPVTTDQAPAQARAALSEEDTSQLEAWWKKYNLDPNDPGQLVADPDGDGWSNREEFLADTNPRDPNSLPGVMEGVAMKSMVEIPVPIILREVSKDSRTASIEHTGGAKETVTAGVTPKGSPFRVKAVKYQMKMDKHGVLTDMSQVTLENPESKETVFLVRDLPARSSQTHAVIVGADGKEQQIHFDETFTLAGHPGKQFVVVELRAEQVVVQQVGSKSTLVIPKR